METGCKRMIAVTPEEARYLEGFFKITHVTLWAALRYKKDNTLHRKIRKTALERGGVRMVLSPEADTIYLVNCHDADRDQKRYMIQTLGNGVTIEGCLDTGRIEVRNRKGEVVKKYANPHISELRAIQEMAQKL